MYWFASCRRAHEPRTPALRQPFSSARRLAMKPVDYTLGFEISAMNKFFATLSATLFLASCAVGPNYRAPPVAPAVVKNARSGAFVTQPPEAPWWRGVGATERKDPRPR